MPEQDKINSLNEATIIALMGDRGGACVLAQVIVSCDYTGSCRFDIAELCRLDKTHYKLAMDIIELRTWYNKSPGETVGHDVVSRLIKKFNIDVSTGHDTSNASND